MIGEFSRVGAKLSTEELHDKGLLAVPDPGHSVHPGDGPVAFWPAPWAAGRATPPADMVRAHIGWVQ